SHNLITQTMKNITPITAAAEIFIEKPKGKIHLTPEWMEKPLVRVLPRSILNLISDNTDATIINPPKVGTMYRIALTGSNISNLDDDGHFVDVAIKAIIDDFDAIAYSTGSVIQNDRLEPSLRLLKK